MRNILSFCLSFISFIACAQTGTNQLNSADVRNTTSKLNATSCRADGDSYVTCNGCSPSSDGFAPLMATYFGYGSSFTNGGIGATGVCSFAKNNLININPGHSVFEIVGMVGYNDTRFAGYGQTTLLKIANCVNAMLANQFLKVYYPADSSYSGITRYGTWSLYTGLAEGLKTNKGAFSDNTNDSIVYRFTDSTLVLGLAGSDGVVNVFSTFNVYIDNILQGSYTENSQFDGVTIASYNNEIGPMALIFTGLPYTAHKVTIVNTNGAGVAPLVVDYFGHFVDRSVAMPIVFMEAPQDDSTGFATTPTNFSSMLAIIAADNTLDSTILAFQNGSWYAQNYPVYIGKTNQFFNPSLLGPDHIHPSVQAGYAAIAAAGEDAITTQTSFPNGRMFMNNFHPLITRNGYNYQLDKPLLPKTTLNAITGGGSSTVPGGATSAVQFNSSGAFAGDATNFNWSSTTLNIGLNHLSATGTSTSTYQTNMGSLYYQQVASINNWTIGENLYHASGGYSRVATGYSEGWLFQNGSILFYLAPTGSAGLISGGIVPLTLQQTDAPVVFNAPTTTLATVNFPAGTAKTSPVQGDMYATTGHFYYYDQSTRYDFLSYAPIASPTFTGTPAAPTAAAGTNTTQIATTAFVNGAIATYPHTIFTPTTGGTVALVANQYNIINPSGALLALTLNLPSSPTNGQVVYIKFTQTISTVTYANGSVIDGITAPTAGGLTVLVYDSGTTSWY